MKRNFCITFICTILLAFSINIFGQTDYKKISIASPNAASFGKFVDVPVNYHTGIPEIGIPIHSLISGTLELPISLSYHAGGLKVAETASWVGSGWSLNAGGIITRTVRGIPDEAVNTNRGLKGHFTDYGYSSYYSAGSISTPLTTIALRDSEIKGGVIDGEPDLFFFNFGGHSGKFFFNDDRTPILVSGNDDLKIDYFYGLTATEASSLNKNIQGFCISTNDGTKYFFGKTTAAEPVQGVTPVEISIPYSFSNGLSSDRVVSSWYLSRIESADKSSAINLYYESETYSTYSWSYDQIFDNVNDTNKGYNLYKMFFNGVRLTSIETANGKVVFSTANESRLDLAGGNLSGGNPLDIEAVNTSAKALKDISVFSGSRLLKKVVFYSSYFTDNNTSLPSVQMNLVTDRKRLKLDSIKQSGTNGTFLKPYKFQYSGSFMARRLSFALDHWGYYNGTSNTGVLPTITRDTYNVIYQGGANRESDEQSMKLGALTKITYPLDGFTDFEFEANRAKVDAVRYDLVYDNQYSVGFGGSYSEEYQNIPFDGSEKYELKFTNTGCATGISNCTASYSILNANGGIVSSGSAGGGETSKIAVNIPAGNYKIRLYRDGAYSGTGATLVISKFIPQHAWDPIIGGLRIKTLTKAPIIGNSIVYNYTYEDSGRSSGVLYERPYYVAPLRSDMVAKFGMVAVGGGSATVFPQGCFYFPGSSGVPVVISPSSIMPLSNTQGSHIGYGTVKISQNSNGYSIYKFYVPSVFESIVTDVAYRNVVSNLCDTRSPSFPVVPLPYEFDRGEIKSQYTFDKNDQLLKSVSYVNSFDSTKVYTPAIIVKDIRNLAYTFAEYNLRGYWKKYSVKSETIIDKLSLESLTTVDTTFYTSLNHRSPTKIVSEQSAATKLITNFKYVFDFNLPSTISISDGWIDFQGACNTCNVQYQNSLSSPNSNPETQRSNFSTLRMCLAIARKNYVNYRRLNFTDANSTYNNIHLNAKNNANSELKPILEMQDRYINAPLEITKFVNNKLIEATFHSYDFEANTSNVQFESKSNIAIAGPLSDFLVSSITNSTLVKDSRYLKDVIYKTLRGRISEQRQPKGPIKSYLWGYNNEYPISEVSNASSNRIHYEGFEESTSYQNLVRDVNKPHTGRYSALINNTSSEEKVSHGNRVPVSLSAPQKFIYSGWVYSDGPSTQIFLFMLRAGETGYFSYTDNVNNNLTGKWVYLQKEVTVPADVSEVYLRLDNNGAGNAWFDDLRIYPADAQMKTYSYDPLVGMTSEMDTKGQTIYYGYDIFQRLSTIKDQNGYIIKTFHYNQ